MTKLVVFIGFLFSLTCVENRIISLNYVTLPASGEQETETTLDDNQNIASEKDLIYKNFEDDPEEYTVNNNKPSIQEKNKKPCAIVVLSNMQSPSMQSLLRKYRYDANGMLIPSSVKYFIKLPQGLRSSPLLVPLNDKAFSPLGGFVRYYKEVPPIPHSW